MIERLEQLYSAARVMDPDRNWSWVRSIISRIWAREFHPSSKRDKIVPVKQLFDLGRDFMRRSTSESTSLKRAILYRDGIMINFLSARPLRLRNFLDLDVSRTFVRRADTWWIDVPAAETKTKDPIEMPIPEELTEPIDEYIRNHRSVLCLRKAATASPINGALWVSDQGLRICDVGVRERFSLHTRAAFGFSINPHLFRDCLVTSIATDDPVHFGVAVRILGHRTRRTTEKSYEHARSVNSIRIYQQLIIGIRDGTVQPGDGEEKET